MSRAFEVDHLLIRTNGDLSFIEKEPGILAGQWQGKDFVRIDIPNPGSTNIRLPSGNESGANPLWIPGGRLPGGKLEAVVDPDLSPEIKTTPMMRFPINLFSH